MLHKAEKRCDVPGIVWQKNISKWEARTTHEGQRIVIGYYKQLPHAKTAMEAVKRVLKKEFTAEWV